MNVFGLVSSVLLAIMLFWAIYHAWIIFAGLRSKRNSTFSCNNRNGDWLPKFSLIVPAKDESAVINRCLNTLMQLTYPKEKMELLVVAGASEDGTKEMCLDFSEKYPENVRVVCEDFSRGKPAALNLAFTHATGE